MLSPREWWQELQKPEYKALRWVVVLAFSAGIIGLCSATLGPVPERNPVFADILINLAGSLIASSIVTVAAAPGRLSQRNALILGAVCAAVYMVWGAWDRGRPFRDFAKRLASSNVSCVLLEPIAFDDRNWTATTYVAQQLKAHLKGNRAAPELIEPNDLSTLPPDECDGRIEGVVTDRSGGRRSPFVGTIRFIGERGRQTADVVADLNADKEPRHFGAIVIAESFDSLAQRRPKLRDLRYSAGRTRRVGACADYRDGAAGYLRSAMRDAVARIATESLDRRLVIVKRVVTQPSENDFEVELWYYLSPTGQPAHDFLPQCHT